MIAGMVVFLMIVLSYGWYRTGFGFGMRAMSRPRVTHKLTVEQAPPSIDLRAASRVSMVEMMRERDEATRVLALAYKQAIEAVVVQAAKQVMLTEERDDYGHVIRVAARLRVIPGAGAITVEAVRDRFSDGEGRVSLYDFLLDRNRLASSVLDSLFQREGRRD